MRSLRLFVLGVVTCFGAIGYTSPVYGQYGAGAGFLYPDYANPFNQRPRQSDAIDHFEPYTAFVSTLISEFFWNIRRSNPGYWQDKWWGWHGKDEKNAYRLQQEQYYQNIMKKQDCGATGAYVASWGEIPHQAFWGETVGGDAVSGTDQFFAANATALALLGQSSGKASASTGLARRAPRRSLPPPFRGINLDLERGPDGVWGPQTPPRRLPAPPPARLPGPKSLECPPPPKPGAVGPPATELPRGFVPRAKKPWQQSKGAEGGWVCYGTFCDDYFKAAGRKEGLKGHVMFDAEGRYIGQSVKIPRGNLELELFHYFEHSNKLDGPGGYYQLELSRSPFFEHIVLNQ